MDDLAAWGYLGLFIAAFLAATLVPLSPEVVVLLLFQQGYSPLGLTLVATIAGYFGSLTNYYIGSGGSTWVLGRWLGASPERIAQARRAYERWGVGVLFFSWLPFVGEPLLIVGGLLKIRLAVFTFWVLFGRLVRFGVVLGLADPLLT